MRGLAGRISPHRAARLFSNCKPLFASSRFDVPAAKWLKVTSRTAGGGKVTSLNLLACVYSGNGFTHQDPGFLDHVINKEGRYRPRPYLPPDANLHRLSVFDHCLRSGIMSNVVVAGKHALPQWLTMDAAVMHCTEGIGIWQWASNDEGGEPDVVMACCGDTPTLVGGGFHSSPASARD